MSRVSTPLPRVLNELRRTALLISAPASAARLWERYLTPDDRERLGGNLEEAYCRYRTAGMWAELRGVTLQRAVIEVANLIGFLRDEDSEWLLRETGEVVEVEEAMSSAIASGDLVLVEWPREAYWNGESIEIDWNQQGALWEFLWELSCQAKAGQPIDAFTFGGNTHRDVVTKRKSRLTNMSEFPIDLTILIESVSRGTQQLMLPRERIRVFERTGIDTLGEWTP